MTPDEVMLKQPKKKHKKRIKIDEKVLSECFKKKDIVDKASDLLKKIDDSFGNIKPFITISNMADPLNDPEYDGEGAKKSVVVGIKMSF